MVQVESVYVVVHLLFKCRSGLCIDAEVYCVSSLAFVVSCSFPIERYHTGSYCNNYTNHKPTCNICANSCRITPFLKKTSVFHFRLFLNKFDFKKLVGKS